MLKSEPAEEDWARVEDRRKDTQRGRVNYLGFTSAAILDGDGRIWYWSSVSGHWVRGLLLKNNDFTPVGSTKDPS